MAQTIDAKAVPREAIGDWTSKDDEVYTRTVNGPYLQIQDEASRALGALRTWGEVDAAVAFAPKKEKRAVQKHPFALKFRNAEGAKKVVSIMWRYSVAKQLTDKAMSEIIDKNLLISGKQVKAVLAVSATKTRGHDLKYGDPPRLLTVVFYHDAGPGLPQNSADGYYPRYTEFINILKVAIGLKAQSSDDVQIVVDQTLTDIVVRSVDNVAAIIKPRHSLVAAHTQNATCMTCSTTALHVCSRCKQGTYCGIACQAQAHTSGNYCCGEETA